MPRTGKRGEVNVSHTAHRHKVQRQRAFHMDSPCALLEVGVAQVSRRSIELHTQIRAARRACEFDEHKPEIIYSRAETVARVVDTTYGDWMISLRQTLDKLDHTQFSSVAYNQLSGTRLVQLRAAGATDQDCFQLPMTLGARQLGKLWTKVSHPPLQVEECGVAIVLPNMEGKLACDERQAR